MKKLTITLMLVITLLCSVVLTACTSYTEPTASIRWEDGESYTYIVSMQPTTIPDAVTYNDNDFYSVTELVTYTSLDMVTPQDVTGTYTTTIVLDGDNWVYTTVLDVYETYDTSSDYYYAEFVTDFVDSLTTEQYSTLVSETTTNSVTLHSVSTSSVTFSSSYKQTAVSSTRDITGYYIGETYQETTDVDITCSYDSSESTATVTGTSNGSTVDNTASLTDGTIDSAQLALYSRSLDQSEAFETSATVTVFEPITYVEATATISLTQEYLLLLDIEEDGDYNYTSVNSIDILIDSTYTAYRMFNNPSDTMSSSASATGLNKNTAVMFQSGIYVFQFESYTHLYDDLAYVAS